jgi:hypothetical protein
MSENVVCFETKIFSKVCFQTKCLRVSRSQKPLFFAYLTNPSIVVVVIVIVSVLLLLDHAEVPRPVEVHARCLVASFARLSHGKLVCSFNEHFLDIVCKTIQLS